jgi:hypothetical protein
MVHFLGSNWIWQNWYSFLGFSGTRCYARHRFVINWLKGIKFISTLFLVTMAKGIGNGFPLAAVITTSEIAKTLTEAAYFNTFGGNPLASCIGSNVLSIIEEENLQKNSDKVGSKLLRGLADLQNKYSDIVGDVRGKGLMVGMELKSKDVSL